MESPIDFAKKGDLEYFKNLVEIDSLQNSKDRDGHSVLSTAAEKLHLECCQEILRRCPSLLYHQSSNGNTVLHVVASHKNDQGIKLLKIFIDVEENMKRSAEILHSENLLIMANIYGQTALHCAVKSKSGEAVKLLIQADTEKKSLMMVDDDKNTALHLALQTLSHYPGIALILLDSYPSYDIGSNIDGDTPLLMVVRQCGRETSSGSISAEILDTMLTKEPLLAEARRGARGWTALHHAAFGDNINAIIILLQHCPDCCKVVNDAGRNFLHIAVEHGRVGVVRCVLGWKTIPYSVLNLQDNSGYTPLHIAALKENNSLTECLLYDNRISKITTNVHGQKVLNAVNFDYDKVKAGVFGDDNHDDDDERMSRISGKEMKEQSEFDLLVSALIATVTFTAGLTIPGGYFSDEHNQGMAVLSKRAPFIAFVISNNFAFMFSLYSVFSHFCARRLTTIEDTTHHLSVATRCTFGAIFAMMIAFVTGSYIVLASSKVLSLTACVQCCCFFVFAVNAMRRF